MLTNPLFRLLRQSGVYALGNVAMKGAGLVLLFFYLDPEYLSQSDYGRLVLLETTANFLLLFAGLGLASGLLKCATDLRYAADWDALPFTTLVFVGTSALVMMALLWTVRAPLAGYVLDDPTALTAIQYVGAYVLLQALLLVPKTVLRLHEHAGAFLVAVVLEFGALVASVYYFLVVRGMGLEGVLLAMVASSFCVTVWLVGRLLHQSAWLLQPSMLHPLLGYGLPLAFASFASTFLNSGDLYVLEAFTSVAQVAVYGLAAKFGSVINMLFVQSFYLAFNVIGLKVMVGNEGGGADVHRRVARHFTVVTGWGVLGVALLAPDLAGWISENPAYLDVEALLLPIALGYLANGIYYISMNGLYAAGWSKSIALGVFVGGSAQLRPKCALGARLRDHRSGSGDVCGLRGARRRDLADGAARGGRVAAVGGDRDGGAADYRPVGACPALGGGGPRRAASRSVWACWRATRCSSTRRASTGRDELRAAWAAVQDKLRF